LECKQLQVIAFTRFTVYSHKRIFIPIGISNRLTLERTAKCCPAAVGAKARAICPGWRLSAYFWFLHVDFQQVDFQ
jgi:hypothetical protein